MINILNKVQRSNGHWKYPYWPNNINFGTYILHQLSQGGYTCSYQFNFYHLATLCFTQGNLKGGLAVAAILMSLMEGSYCVFGFFVAKYTKQFFFQCVAFPVWTYIMYTSRLSCGTMIWADCTPSDSTKKSWGTITQTLSMHEHQNGRCYTVVKARHVSPF